MLKTYLKYLNNDSYEFDAIINYTNRMKTGAQVFFRKMIIALCSHLTALTSVLKSSATYF